MAECDRTGVWNQLWNRLPWILLGCFLCFPSVGCRGCLGTSNSASAKKKAEEKKKKELKPRVSTKDVKSLPSGEDQPLAMKPGHWIQARQEAKANEGNESMEMNLEMTDRRLRTLPIRGTSNYIRFVRDVTIAKGQTKSSEIFFYHPEIPADLDENGMIQKPSLRISYAQKGIGVPVAETPPMPSNIMRAEQYLVLVMSKDPPRHQFWGGLSCMTWPSDDRTEEEKISPHRVIRVSEADLANVLPDRIFAWTSMSHLVWYDIDAGQFSDVQQQALMDWLYMGGQIIVSGADCLGGINNSFLAPYLPLSELKMEQLTTNLVEPFSNYWTVRSENSFPLVLPENRSVPALRGTLRPESRWVDGAEGMVAERSVGNGRIVMSTFPLSDDLFVRWRSYGSFINGGLLRHAPRDWVATSKFNLGKELVYASNFRGRETDPSLSTRFRLLTRDGSGVSNWYNATDVQQNEKALVTTRSTGSWNDASTTTLGSVGSLTAASGITVPKVSVIIKLLAGYLFFLVPLNWIVFRLMGRVELAWVAAPVIAIVGAVVVARSVQLDIGFSRSESRISIVEAYEGHPRAHQTSYVALYTSLSTFYKAVFEKETGIVLPLSAGGGLDSTRRKKDRQDLVYRYGQDGGNGIHDFSVLSNSTGMLHSEEMIELGGAIQASIQWEGEPKIQFQNNTKQSLRGVAVFGVNRNKKPMQQWLGNVAAKQSLTKSLLEMTNVSDVTSDPRWASEWDQDPLSKKSEGVLQANGTILLSGNQSSLGIGDVFAAVLRGLALRPGQCVAIGFSEEETGSLEVYPKAAQQNRRTVFVIHLTPADEVKAMPDVALPQKAKTDEAQENEDADKEKAEFDKQIKSNNDSAEPAKGQ